MRRNCINIFLTIAIIGFILNKFGGLDIILCLIMLGSTLGYLVHNFHQQEYIKEMPEVHF